MSMCLSVAPSLVIMTLIQTVLSPHCSVMQEFIPAQEYCTHSTVRNGHLQLHCCCRSSAFQVNYEHVDQPDIEEWIRTFAGSLELTRQVSLDFIQADDGEVYAIECNPGTHSAITMFYDRPDVAKACLQI
jgi:hypothetical protein